MALLTLGISHKTAPVNIRERVAFSSDSIPVALTDLAARLQRAEVAILSTCNRTELVCHGDGDSEESLLDWLGEFRKVKVSELRPHLYRYPNLMAVRHMMRVAVGIDSMVLGEPQVLGQVKSAYHSAARAGTLGVLLNRLFQQTFAVAKQVRTDTGVGTHPVSVAYTAITLARQVVGDLNDCSALLLGAGETMELAAQHLYRQSLGEMVVANRTLSRAHALADRYGGYAVGLDAVTSQLDKVDLVIAATDSPEYLITLAQCRQAMAKRRHRPIFMADLSMPRTLDPALQQLEDIYLYSLDDIQAIVDKNSNLRRTAAQQAELLIETQAERFMGWWQSRGRIEQIKQFRRHGELLRDQVLATGRRRLRAGDDPDQVLAMMAHRLTNKLLHQPSVALHRSDHCHSVEMQALVRSLYGLEDGE